MGAKHRLLYTVLSRVCFARTHEQHWEYSEAIGQLWRNAAAICSDAGNAFL
jgi:hypothetical protein